MSIKERIGRGMFAVGLVGVASSLGAAAVSIHSGYERGVYRIKPENIEEVAEDIREIREDYESFILANSSYSLLASTGLVLAGAHLSRRKEDGFIMGER